MKPNYGGKDVSINSLNAIYKNILPTLLKSDPKNWKSLDVDYFPPRVERLYTDIFGFRLYLHCIHKTEEPCLYHKHRWPSVIMMLAGSYEMGITYSEKEVSSEEAHNLPTLCKLKLTAGSMYEMTQTDALHYVKPLTEVSYSIMLTDKYYPEAETRKEVLTKELQPLSDERKLELQKMFRRLVVPD